MWLYSARRAAFVGACVFVVHCSNDCGGSTPPQRPDAGAATDAGERDDGSTGPARPLTPLRITLGGPGEDRGFDVALYDDGSMVVVGGLQGEVDLNPGAAEDRHISRGVIDAFVVRLAADGTHLWARTFGGPGLDEAQAVATTADGGAVVLGGFQGTIRFGPEDDAERKTSEGDQDLFIVRLSSSGEVVWARSLGGEGVDFGYDLAVGNDGTVYVAGKFQNAVDFDPGESSDVRRSAGFDDAFVLALTGDGELRWIRTIGGESMDQAYAIAMGGNDHLYVAGLFADVVDLDPSENVSEHTSQGSTDVFLLALDGQGRAAWARTFGGARADFANALAVTPSGMIVLGGRFGSPVDFAPGGNARFEPVGGSDGYLAAFDPSGELLWARTVGGPGLDNIRDVATGPGNHIVATGQFEGQISFGPSENSETAESRGGLDAFLWALDAQGGFLWAETFGGEQEDRCEALELGADGAPTLTGHFRHEVVLPGPEQRDGGAAATAQRADTYVLRLRARSAQGEEQVP